MAAASLMMCVGCANNDQTKAPQQKAVIQPGEQAPLADVGQKNFGGFQNGDTTGMAARRKAMMEAMNKIRTLSFDELSMSDPFIYPDPETKTYYLPYFWKSQLYSAKAATLFSVISASVLAIMALSIQ